MSSIHLNGIIFYSIMDDMSYEEMRDQEKLWGRQHIDYVVELKSKDRYRFFISENLYNRR